MRAVALALALALPGLAHAEPKPGSADWRSDRPKVPEAPTPVLPTFEKATLDNGLTVLVANVDALPVVSFNLVTKGGATYDPKGKAGLTALTYALLEEGAGDLDALAFSNRVADLGAEFSARASRDSGSVTIDGLSRNAGPMLALLADAVIRPKLTKEDFERRKAQTIASLMRNRGSPQGLAFERFPALVYGPEHPLGHPPSGVPETVKDITHAEVQQQLAKVLGPAHSALVVAGDLTLDEATKLAEAHFGAWQREAAPPPDIPAVEATNREEILLIDKPGAAQTMVILGRPLFERGHPDEFALRLANQVFGGTFAARLNMLLREQKGYTYGARSQTAFRRGVGVFIAYSALRADVTAAGLEDALKEVENLETEPPTEAELEAARSGLIRSLPGQFEVTSEMAGAASALFVYDLPLDYFAKLGEQYDAVDLAAVRKAALDYLVADQMKILLVGDASLVREQLEKLGRGSVVVD